MVEANKGRILFTLNIVFLQNVGTYLPNYSHVPEVQYELHNFSHFNFNIVHLVGFYYKDKNHFHLFHHVGLNAFLPTTFADTSLHYHSLVQASKATYLQWIGFIWHRTPNSEWFCNTVMNILVP